MEELATSHVYTSPPCSPAEALKGVRTVKFEDLPDDVIQAARRRRQRDVERCGAPLGTAGRPVCPGSAPAGSQRVLQGGAPISRGCCLPLLLHQSPQHAPACSCTCTCACLRLPAPNSSVRACPLHCRDMGPLDLDSIELPDNHPFAVKKKLDPGLWPQHLADQLPVDQPPAGQHFADKHPADRPAAPNTWAPAPHVAPLCAQLCTPTAAVAQCFCVA